MRLARVVEALLTLILAAGLGQTLVSPADAMGKPRHSLPGVRVGEVGRTNHFYIKGKVATFPKGKVKVLRNVAGGKYHVYKKVKTKSSGKFHTSINQAGNDKTCFKLQVPATDVYRKTTSRVLGCIESG